MDVTESGSGSPLVFIPGWLATSAWWDQQISHFEGSHRVLALDYGRGPATTIDGCADDLGAVLDRLPELPIVIGWSLGAAVAMRFTERFGTTAIAGLVLVDQTPRSFPGPDWMHGVIGLDQATLRRAPALARQALPATVERVVMTSFATHPDAQTLARLVAEAGRWSPEVAASLIEDHWSRDYRSGLARIAVPTLIVAGERSAFTPIGAVQYLHRQIPGSRLEVMAGCGHAPFVERPDAFNALVERFIAEVAA